MSDEEGEYELEGGEEYEIEEEGGSNAEEVASGTAPEGEEQEDDENIVENTYYNAKGSIEEDVNEALEMFQTVLDMEEKKGTWGFKSLKQMIKALFNHKRYEKMVEKYKQLLTFTNVVSRNDSEKAISKVLNFATSSNDADLVDRIYNITLEELKKTGNENLWFNTKIRLATFCFEKQNYSKLVSILEELKQSCKIEGKDEFDPRKSSQLLDVYVLEIQMHTKQLNLKKLKALYLECKRIMKDTVVLNPRVTGVIKECGAKMYMREKTWKNAHNDFFEAFKSYDEAGNIRRINCLKYLVLSNILANITINPFDGNEAKPYKNHPEIVAMTDLVSSYQRGDIKLFERVLKQNASIREDEFINAYIPDLLRNIRNKVIIELIKPYTRVRMSFIARELGVQTEVVESLCVDLILDKLLDGHIDQMNQVLILSQTHGSSRFQSMQDWTRKISELNNIIVNKIS